MNRVTVVLALLLLLVGCGGPSSSNPGTPGGGEPITISASPANLSFPGTATATVSVSASGSWTAVTDQAWLDVSPTSGTGDAAVTVSVNRSGVSPNHYAGSVLFKGGDAREVVTVYMRFPEVSGNVTGPAGQIEPGSVSAQGAPLEHEEGNHVPGEVLVMLEPGAVALAQGIRVQDLDTHGDLTLEALESSAMDVASSYGFQAGPALSAALPVFTLSTGGMPVGDAIRALRADGRVRHAQPNWIVTSHATPNDPRYSEQWHYGNIDLPQAWDLTVGSSEVIVAVVDSGVDTTHPDLAANLLPGYDFVGNTSTLSDPDGHGTHVSGTVAAVSDNGTGVAGVGWHTKIRPVRVLDDTGSGTEANIFRGIAFAAGLCVNNSAGTQICPSIQADVINLSLGPNNDTCLAMPQDSIMEEAIAYATGNGSTVVASAGNDNCNVVGVPAAYAGAIAVAATGPTDGRAPYSNYGPEIWVAAPGGDQAGFGSTGGVLSTQAGGGYVYFQGTSMAAPHVSGVAALVLAANPDLSPVEVQFLLAQTATDLGPAGWDQEFGYGLIDADAAVLEARNLLSAHYSDFIVRLTDGGSTVAETRADDGGNFALENVPAGSYTLEGGTDTNRNGVLGEPGEFYGSSIVAVNYTGDVSSVGLSAQPQ